MKRNALVAFGLLLSLVSAGAVFGKEVKNVNNFAIAKKFDITVDQARKAALKKVPGEVEDEYTIEDEDGNLTAYVFVIKNAAGKKFDVQIDAQKGNVLSADEQEEYEVESVDEDPEEEVESTEPEEVEPMESEEVESTDSQEVEESNVSDEDDSAEVESNVSEDEDDSDEVSMKDDDEKVAQPKVSMEEARAKALKKAKGEIQEEALITDDGDAYYAFTIKGKKDKMTEVRVDANSGKTKKVKTPTSE